MGIIFSDYVIAEGFNLKSITDENIRFAYVIRLPFRLRVGRFYRASLAFRKHSFEISLRNRIVSPPNIPIEKVISSVESYDELWTDALVVIQNPKLDERAIERVRNWDPEEGNFPLLAIGHEFEAMQALNHFIIAYATTTKNVFGGTPLRLFRSPEFFDFRKVGITIIGPAEEALTDEDITNILNWRPNIKMRSLGAIQGDLHDFQVEDLAAIEKAMALQKDFIFFEAAFEAKSKIIIGDYVGALLMSVVALEGVQAALVQHELGLRLSHSKDKQLPDEFLKELGLSLCNRLTPYLFMTAEERPSPELIQECAIGIKFRNEIMHALKNRAGEYRLRTRTNKEISEAYSAVLKVYDCYVSALKKRLGC